MRFLADENVPRSMVERLRARGADVVWVAEVMPGASDASIARRASRQRRIVVTFDRDFAPRARASVIVVRLRHAPSFATDTGVETILARDDWDGYRSVIDGGGVRRRRIG